MAALDKDGPPKAAVGRLLYPGNIDVNITRGIIGSRSSPLQRFCKNRCYGRALGVSAKATLPMTPDPQQFASDNYAGICPEAWAAMAEANQGHARAYGDDAWTQAASDAFRDLFEKA